VVGGAQCRCGTDGAAALWRALPPLIKAAAAWPRSDGRHDSDGVRVSAPREAAKFTAECEDAAEWLRQFTRRKPKMNMTAGALSLQACGSQRLPASCQIAAYIVPNIGTEGFVQRHLGWGSNEQRLYYIEGIACF
jgi:hypothetical protein